MAKPFCVLVAEDEQLTSLLVSETLVTEGYRVLTASSGDDAAHILQSSLEIDVLFTDIHMPGLVDGAALARTAREGRPSIAVVYASGRVGGIRELDAVEGAEFLPKPFLPRQVAAKVAQALERTRRPARRAV